jgi:hypothetical protein
VFTSTIFSLDLENILVGLDTKRNSDDFISFKWYRDHIHKFLFFFWLSTFEFIC